MIDLVLLAVCLLATSRRNYRWDLREIFIGHVSVNKKDSIIFWKSCVRLDPCIGIFKNFVS